MPHGLSTIGAFQLSANEMLIFGGWDDSNQSSTYLLRDLGQNSIQISSEPDMHLAEPDIFLFNGAFRQDTDRGEVTVCG